MIMRKVIAFFIPLQLAVFLIHAQSLTPEVVAAQGSYNETASLSLEWTLGETFIETTPGRAILLTEGLHQPMLPLREVRSENSPLYNYKGLTGEPGGQYEIAVYPNPFQSEISIEIDGELNQDFTVTLLNVNGTMIRKLLVPFGTGEITIDGLDLPPSVYLIKVEGASRAGTHIREVIKFN